MKPYKLSWFSAGRMLIIGTVVAVSVGIGTIGYINHTNNSVQAASCPTNDIMPCGAASPSAFIDKLRANNPSDMQTIYTNYALPQSNYDWFVAHAQQGKINPDTGNITVNGITVGYDGLSLGRNSKGSRISQPVTIGGKTYYESHIKDLTKYENNAMVMFDAHGNLNTVIMNLCGNPIRVTPNNPSYNCNALNVKQDSRNIFTFSADVSALNGATVTKLIYDAGDGDVVTVAPGQTFTHAYEKNDNTTRTYTAKVTAYVKTTFSEGEFAIPVTANCQKIVTVEAKPEPKISIVKTVDGSKDTKTVKLNTNFIYNINITNTGNVDLKNVVVTDPSPNVNIKFISANPGSIVNNALSYSIPTLAVRQSVTINITAQLKAYVVGEITNNACVDTPTIAPSNPDASCDTVKIEIKKPSVTITKVVNDKKSDNVALGANFIYTLHIANDNDGEVALTNVVVKDNAPQNVQFVSTDSGSIVDNALSYVIPKLDVGKSVDVKITAKVITYTADTIKNTACVNAPEVNPDNPTKDDACDSATVTVPAPGKVWVCDQKSGDKIQVPETDKTKYGDVNSIECTKVSVCDQTTGNKIDGIKYVDRNKYKLVDSIECTKVSVCDAATQTIIGDIKYIDKDKYLPADSDKCVKMSVCVIADGTGVMNPITKDKFDASKYSTNSASCVNLPVCRLSDKMKTTIKQNQFDSAVYSKNQNDCNAAPVVPTTPQVLPAVMPNTGAGNVIGLFLGTTFVAGLFHRVVLRRKNNV